jgi:hypothetical protein
MRFGLRRETEGRSEWLDYRGEWSADETDRALFDSPAECFRVSEGLPFFASVEAITEQVQTADGAEQ